MLHDSPQELAADYLGTYFAARAGFSENDCVRGEEGYVAYLAGHKEMGHKNLMARQRRMLNAHAEVRLPALRLVAREIAEKRAAGQPLLPEAARLVSLGKPDDPAK